MSLELGEGHFDRIEIGAVGRQEQEPAAVCLEQSRRLLALVGGQVVEDDDGSGLQFRDQDLLDVSVKGVAIHRARDHPWRDDAVAGQARDQGLVPPPPERGAPLEMQTLETPSIGAGHIRVCAGFVEKNQALGVDPHDLLTPGPVMSRLAHCGLFAFPGDQPFFLYVYPRRRSSASMPLAEHATS